MDFVIRHSYLIPLLPLLGAAAAGLFGARYLKNNSHWPIWIGVGASALLSFVLLFGMLREWNAHHGAAADQPHGVRPAEVTDESSEDAAQAHGETFPTLKYVRHLFTWIRAGTRQVEAIDEATGKPLFDASGQPVMKMRHSLRGESGNAVSIASSSSRTFSGCLV